MNAPALDSAGLLDLAIEVAGTLDPRDVMRRIVERGVLLAAADRCTLSRLDGDVFIVEAVVEPGREVAWTGRTYDMAAFMRQPLLKRAIDERRPILGDRLDVAGAAPDVAAEIAEVHHTAVVPIFSGDDVSAVLVFVRMRPVPFHPTQVPALSALATLAGMALRNAMAHEASLAHSLRSRAAVDIALGIGSGNNLRKVLDSTLLNAHRAARADAAAITTIDGSDCIIEATTGFTQVGGRVRFYPDVLASLLAGETRQYSTEDIRRWERGDEMITRFSHMVLTPMRLAGETYGALAACRFSGEPAFTDDDIAGLIQFAAMASLLLCNARLLDDLTQAERRKREFIDIFVHELRNPLTVIAGYSELLASTGATTEDPAIGEALSIINSKAGEASGLVTDLITLARMESGDLRIASEAVPVGALLRDAAGRAGARAALHGGAVTVTDVDDNLFVHADSRLVARILDNLLVNAQTYVSGAAHIRLEVEVAGDVLTVTVADNGVGIHADERESIFKRYVRGRGGSSKHGTGLGLYVSRECARLMGGDLILQSSIPEGGSVFALSLPRRPGDAASGTTPSAH